MRLSKKIPARTKTINFEWIREFQLAGPLNTARVSIGMKPFSTCFWCNYEFGDMDMTYLASVIGKGNKILCANCNKKALESREE